MRSPTTASSAQPAIAAAVTHYENFPVASWLCPPRLRAPIAAIYHFARTADDLADEGDPAAAVRLADLAAYRADLQSCAAGQPVSARWAQVFGPLAEAIRAWQLPTPYLAALLDAFEQDVRMSAAQARYASDAELLDYCTRSANPVGRLLLHLYGIDDAPSRVHSDAICSALQLINFWQDLRVDLARGRWYPSREAMARWDVLEADLQPASRSAQARRMVQDYCGQARALMRRGAPLALRVPGRAGWELRLVVQGGLRILDKIAALDHMSWRQRPTLGAWDLALMLWRALWMRG